MGWLFQGCYCYKDVITEVLFTHSFTAWMEINGRLGHPINIFKRRCIASVVDLLIDTVHAIYLIEFINKMVHLA